MSDARKEILDEFEDETEPKNDNVPQSEEDFESRARAYFAAAATAARLEAWKAEDVGLLAAKFDARIRAARSKQEHHKALIDEGVRRLEPDRKGKRTVRVPSMTAFVTTRVSIPRPEDDTELIALGKSLGVEPKQSPDWAGIKKHLDTSESDEGLRVVTTDGQLVEFLRAEVSESVTIREA